ncbi:DegV family protein [Chryseomicrobium sp. FSL W7-1435]|uniref:DegV family protein n=1 Tax=Chryseomicrobium sp. FSL W7-1435 TaxID=2921704 RepID=UPI00315A112C
MTKIAWVTDSSVFPSEKLRNHPDVHIVPLTIHFDNEIFQDGVTISKSEVYDRLAKDKEKAKTSQPPAGEFAKLYEELKESYDEIIAVHLSNELSGTFASSKSGAEIAEVDVHLVDSHSLSAGITGLLEHGIGLQEQGHTAEEIADALRARVKDFENYILIGSLDQLYRGGRLSSAQFYLGNLLKIKPIIHIAPNGKLNEGEKVRSMKKAKQALLDKVAASSEKHTIKKIYLMHGNCAEEANEFAASLRTVAPNSEIIVDDISTVLAVHAGQGTLATLWYND